MAKKGGTARLAANQARLRALQAVIGGSFAVHAVIRLLVFRASTTWITYSGLAMVGLLVLTCYACLAGIARPEYGPEGELYGGGDLSTGMAQHYYDLIYLSCFVLVGSCVTDWAWTCFWLVPIYGAYKAISAMAWMVKQRAAQQSRAEAMQDNPVERKKAERAEQRSQRRRMKRV